MATATLAPTKRSRAQITESQSIASGNPSQLNVETLLYCVLAEAPSAELAQRFAQLNSVYREMAAPTILTQTEHLLSDISQRTPLRSSIPLVPAYMSQSALMNASARDVSWINLKWQMPIFYDLGRCETVLITEEQHDALSELLIRQINGAGADQQLPLPFGAFTASAIARKQAQPLNGDDAQGREVMVVRASAPVKTLSLHYQVPSQRYGQRATEFVRCRVLDLSSIAQDGPDDPQSFVGIPVVSFELCGPYSEPAAVEARLFSAPSRQAALRDI